MRQSSPLASLPFLRAIDVQAAANRHDEAPGRDTAAMTIPGIDFSQTLAGITGEELDGFFVGWKRRRSPSLRLSVLQASHRVVIARDSDQRRRRSRASPRP